MPPFSALLEDKSQAVVLEGGSVHRIRLNGSKYDQAASSLNPDIVQETADVLLNPPQINRHSHLRARILDRLSYLSCSPN